jgi:dephospho-CoA kinase
MKAPLIAVTGPAGSGKSTVVKIFKELGARTISADDVAHKVLLFPEVVKKVVESFGDSVIKDGIIDRKSLAKIVFSNAALLKSLLDIVSSYIGDDISNEVTDFRKNEDKSPIILEAPTLFESGLAYLAHSVVTVESPIDVREKRCKESRGWDIGEVSRRDSFRVPESFRRETSQYVIENVGGDSELRKKVEDLWLTLCAMSFEPETHKKDVCQKCFRMHEAKWTEYNEQEWNDGFISCPVENFEQMVRDGKIIKIDKRSRNFFGFLFGFHKTSGDIPLWCEFSDDHKKPIL